MKRASAGGFSLIELMIGLTLGLFVLGGVIAMFLTSSATAMNQQRLAQVLENGRFGVQVLSDELRQTGAQYCSSYAALLPGNNAVNPLRMPRVIASVTPSWMGAPGIPPYKPLDISRFVRGYECANDGSCAPTVPTSTAQDTNIVPAPGIANGDRVRGTDVLTIRYLDSDGASIRGTVAAAPTMADPIRTDRPVSGDPLNLDNGDLAMIANCASAEVFVATRAGAGLILGAGNDSPALSASYSRRKDARLFNFSRDFRSVTYYVGLRPDQADPAQLVSSLFRIENGGAPEEIIEGVERFDVTYFVVDGRGQSHYLTANAVQTNPGALMCPPVDPADIGAGPADCLWRGVQGMDVSVLVASTRSGPQGDNAFRYSPDGNGLQSYAVNAVLPSGITAGNRLRREFRVYAGVRNLSR